jgi:hypothetical protein
MTKIRAIYGEVELLFSLARSAYQTERDHWWVMGNGRNAGRVRCMEEGRVILISRVPLLFRRLYLPLFESLGPYPRQRGMSGGYILERVGLGWVGLDW